MKKILLLLFLSSMAFGFGSFTVKKIDEIENNTATDITIDPTSDVIITSGIANRVPYFDASKKLKSSSVTDVELGFLSGVTSGLQSQIDGKESTINLTIDRAVISNGLGALSVATTTATELDFVNGVTSNIQNQINAKEPIINLTINRAIISDGVGGLATSTTTNTELDFVNGVTSNVQNQIDAKLTSPLTTNGDLYYYNLGDQRLPIGTLDQLLTVDASGIALWKDAPIVPPATPTTTEGDVILRGVAVDERLPIGTVNQVLTSNGTTALWLTPSGGSGANVNLSNLASPTAINQNLLPSGSRSLGSSGFRWDFIYGTALDISSSATMNSLDLKDGSNPILRLQGSSGLSVKGTTLHGYMRSIVNGKNIGIYTGDNSSPGDILIRGGDGTSGSGSDITIQAGDGPLGANGGNLILTAGSSPTINGLVIIDAAIDKVTLMNQPTGTDPLAVATTDYVDNNSGGTSTPEILVTAASDAFFTSDIGTGNVVLPMPEMSFSYTASNTNPIKIESNGNLIQQFDNGLGVSGDTFGVCNFRVYRDAVLVGFFSGYMQTGVTTTSTGTFLNRKAVGNYIDRDAKVMGQTYVYTFDIFSGTLTRCTLQGITERLIITAKQYESTATISAQYANLNTHIGSLGFTLAGGGQNITAVTITSDNIGTTGNTISLLGDGFSTVDQLIIDWNTANPGLTVTGSVSSLEVPDNTTIFQLDGGLD